MQKHVYNQQTGIRYTLQGDYYLPDPAPHGKETTYLRNQWYISMHRKVLYTNLLTSGKLNGCLADIDEQARKSLESLKEQVKQAQGITEQIKAECTLERLRKMNNIRACAMDIVNKEIIYI